MSCLIFAEHQKAKKKNKKSWKRNEHFLSFHFQSTNSWQTMKPKQQGADAADHAISSSCAGYN